MVMEPRFSLLEKPGMVTGVFLKNTAKKLSKQSQFGRKQSTLCRQGTTELGRLGLADKFQFPKPIGLIEDCLALATRPRNP